MAVDGYVKAAHSQLTAAVSALQTEINELQRELQNRKSNIGGDLGKIDNQIKLHEAAIMVKDQDGQNSEKQLAISQLQSLAREKGEKQSEIQRSEQEITAAINAKSQALANIQTMSGAVNGLLSSSGIK